jgi:hypothetical protein
MSESLSLVVQAKQVAEFNHILEKAKEVHHNGQDSWYPLSCGERLAIAMILNEPMWIFEMGYTLAEAVHRIGPEWGSMLMQAQAQLSREVDWAR